MIDAGVGVDDEDRLRYKDDFPYMLQLWGEGEDLAREWLGFSGNYRWFRTPEGRDDFIAAVNLVAIMTGKTIAMDREDGPHTHDRLVGLATFEHDGIGYDVAYDFGLGCTKDIATYMFNEGNMSCDCNRSRLIRESVDAGFPILGCGETIEMTGFSVEAAETAGPPRYQPG